MRSINIDKFNTPNIQIACKAPLPTSVTFWNSVP